MSAAIIVGNGPLPAGLGPSIDAHPFVHRCNVFRTKPRADTGRRVTHWWLGVCPRLLAEIGLRGLPAGIQDAERLAVAPFGCHAQQQAPVQWGLLGRLHGPLTAVLYRDLPDELTADWRRHGILAPGRWATTGLVAVTWAVGRYGGATVAGFWDGDEAAPICQAGPHDVAAERRLLGEWEAGGRIQRLDSL